MGRDGSMLRLCWWLWFGPGVLMAERYGAIVARSSTAMLRMFLADVTDSELCGSLATRSSMIRHSASRGIKIYGTKHNRHKRRSLHRIVCKNYYQEGKRKNLLRPLPSREHEPKLPSTSTKTIASVISCSFSFSK